MTIQELRDRLRNHDYHHEYADDIRAYRSGVTDQEEIFAALLDQPVNVVYDLVMELVPESARATWIMRLTKAGMWSW